MAAVLAWALLGAFRFPLGLATSPVVAAALLTLTGRLRTDRHPADRPRTAAHPDTHLAKALGLWEAGIAGALTVSPVIASTTIAALGVQTAFMLSGAALIALAAVAATVLAAITVRAGRRSPLPPLSYRMAGTGPPMAGEGVGDGRSA